MSSSTTTQIAETLLAKKAVLLSPKSPFTWASGIKSPIYCDNRQLLSYPDARRQVAEALAELIQEHYPKATVIAGTATAGIPHAAWVSEILNLPMVYVRGKAKDHGRQTQIEGKLTAEDRVVMIEDLISTGGSVLEAAQAVQKICPVLGVAAIFTYQLPVATQNFESAKLPLHVLSHFDTLIETAQTTHYIDQEEYDLVKKWYQTVLTQV